MRKILAVLCTIITLFAIKETIYIFSSTEADIASHRAQLELTTLSITIPLFILTMWLWISRKKADSQ